MSGENPSRGEVLTVNKLLTNSPNITTILGLRIPVYHYALYSNFTREQKRLLKQGVIGLIEAIAADNIRPTGMEKTVILNVNINQNSNHNEAKAEASNKLDIKIYTEIRSSLEELYKWLNWIANPATNRNVPPSVKEQAAKQRNRLALVLQQLDRVMN